MNVFDKTKDNKPIIPVMVVNDIDDTLMVTDALLKGGVKFFEITLRTPDALQAIHQVKRSFPDAIVGAGSVLTVAQLEECEKAAVDFMVSPGFTLDLLKAAQQWPGTFVPGVATASESMQAREQGFYYQKLFPATTLGGLALLKAFSGPIQDVNYCPTGGIDAKNYGEYIALNNVFAIGGSWLTPASLIAEKKWSDITELARHL